MRAAPCLLVCLALLVSVAVPTQSATRPEEQGVALLQEEETSELGEATEDEDEDDEDAAADDEDPLAYSPEVRLRMHLGG